ncbi:helix-turn-helix transcriptional regulator [Priestia megaterium]|uniref:helix-turn-helix domain-containing protein n=1 Tax=Priestia megaterium TaxID=1404 RepID=UPI002E1F76AB|nr:helix-turn-helix transcriptional regulator [Priestia megaterium]
MAKEEARKRIEAEISCILGENMRKARRLRQLNQRQLADKIYSDHGCKLDEKYIGHIEQGRRMPSLYTLKLISLSLGVSLSDLLNEN